MGHRILVAEDDAPIMLGLRDALRGLGYSVAGMVSTAAEAIRQAESEKPDIILMDISLAGPMSGIEAADRIRQRLEIPVVFVTAHSDEATLRQAQAAEPYGFVLKPFDKNDLRIAIELAVYKHRIDLRLRESERRFATILRAIGDAVISTDTRGIIDFVNRAAEALTGRSFPEAVGKPLPGFLLLLDPELRQPLAVDRTWNGEAVLIDAARREIPVVGSIAEMSSEGTAMSGQVVVLRDVTEERRAAELRESRRIEQIITEVSEEERRRFGRDLHDGLGQALTGAAFLCKTLEQKLDGKSQPESADARAIGKVLADATESARELARGAGWAGFGAGAARDPNHIAMSDRMPVCQRVVYPDIGRCHGEPPFPDSAGSGEQCRQTCGCAAHRYLPGNRGQAQPSHRER